jgi:cell fate (sporulation/competence/biofilm development) regulator YlbF (YheA/YmcA/DUF963 family)
MITDGEIHQAEMKTKSFVVRYQSSKKNLEAFMLIKTFLTSVESAGNELIQQVSIAPSEISVFLLNYSNVEN